MKTFIGGIIIQMHDDMILKGNFEEIIYKENNLF